GFSQVIRVRVVPPPTHAIRCSSVKIAALLVEVGVVAVFTTGIGNLDDFVRPREHAVAVDIAVANDLSSETYADEIACRSKADLAQSALVERHRAGAHAWRYVVLAFWQLDTPTRIGHGSWPTGFSTGTGTGACHAGTASAARGGSRASSSTGAA